MKLMTNNLEKKLKPLYSQEGKGVIAVKYFNPFGSGTWLITEGEKQVNGDWLLFGYCHIFEWEWGYVLLSELESIGYIERDLYLPSNTTVKETLKREE